MSDVATRCLPAGNTTVKNVHGATARASELLLCLACTSPALTHQHDWALQVSEIASVFAEGIERHVERTGDVNGLKLAASPHIHKTS